MDPATLGITFKILFATVAFGVSTYFRSGSLCGFVRVSRLLVLYLEHVLSEMPDNFAHAVRHTTLWPNTYCLLSLQQDRHHGACSCGSDYRTGVKLDG